MVQKHVCIQGPEMATAGAAAPQVSEQRVEDLLQLARYRKIGRAQKEARPPASFGAELLQ